MATQLKRHWQPALATGRPRRDRQGCEYAAYLPDSLQDREFEIRGEVAADIVDAETAIARLNAEATALIDSEAMARLLLRTEAVASSKIEGLEVGGRRLLRAELAQAVGEAVRDVTAEAVLGNIRAMKWAVDELAAEARIQAEHLLEVHRRLLGGTRHEEAGGLLRHSQNWIGGSDYNPCSAEFVPPPHEEVAGLLDDLCAFCNRDDLPAVAQAAIAHAQFETIHPFADGNGRVGRCLIHVILKRRGQAGRLLLPVSLVLATRSQDYVGGLTATRYVGDPRSNAAQHGLNLWLSTFAAACQRAVEDALTYEKRVVAMQGEWRERLGRVRSHSAAARLVEVLPGAPVVTVQTAATLVGRSFQAANLGIAELERAGILSRVSIGRRNRAFEALEIIEAFNDLERQMASPLADTRSSPPARPVPRRRNRVVSV